MKEDLIKRQADIYAQHIDVVWEMACFGDYLSPVADIAMDIVKAFENGGKLFLFGNGGSAADAQHIAAEFVNRFQIDRRPLPAIALTTDTSVITSIANDFGYGYIFLKQLQALLTEKDVVIGISTSGRSENVTAAMRYTCKTCYRTIGMCGDYTEKMNEISDHVISIPSDNTARIQEIHILVGHIICELVETIMFGKEE